MVKQFHNFAGGVNMSDAEINSWLRELRTKFFAGTKHYSISCGDTVAIMLTWENSVDFVVSNSCGYSRVTFYGDDVMDDFTELKNWKPEYVRPELVTR